MRGKKKWYVEYAGERCYGGKAEDGTETWFFDAVISDEKTESRWAFATCWESIYPDGTLISGVDKIHFEGSREQCLAEL